MNFRFYVSAPTYYSFDCTPIYGTRWWPKRENQVSVKTLDGTQSTFDIGPTLVEGILLAKNIRMRTSNDIISFFETVTVFKQYSFTINQFAAYPDVALASGSGVDLGSGKGVTVSGVYLRMDEASLDGIFELVAPGYYNMTLPYWYRRT